LKKWSGLFEVQLEILGWMKKQPRVKFSKKGNITFCFKKVSAQLKRRKKWPCFWTTYWMWSAAGVTLFWDNSPMSGITWRDFHQRVCDEAVDNVTDVKEV